MLRGHLLQTQCFASFRVLSWEREYLSVQGWSQTPEASAGQDGPDPQRTMGGLSTARQLQEQRRETEEESL